MRDLPEHCIREAVNPFLSNLAYLHHYLRDSKKLYPKVNSVDILDLPGRLLYGLLCVGRVMFGWYPL